MSSSNKNRVVYLDNAASTPVDSRVKKEMARIVEMYGNPSSYNNIGRLAGAELDKARLSLARFIGARPEETIFASSGSEANNLAIFGLADIIGDPQEIITTPIEHPSVLEPLKILKSRGWKITYLKINSDGFVDLKDLEKKLNIRTVLISVIYANNEIGTIQPIGKISKIIKDFNASMSLKNRNDRRPFFHIDACQAACYLDMNVNNLGADLMTFNGSKMYGPKGSAVLYKKKEVELAPLIYGGDQEYGLRAGTENLSAIVGLATAVSLINKREAKETEKLRDYFINGIGKILPEARLNGPRKEGRLPNNINISVPGIDSENLLLELDKYGIYASAGSACTARSVEPSHVLKAIGVNKKYINGALRLSLGRQTTKKDIEYVLAMLPQIVDDLKVRYGREF